MAEVYPSNRIEAAADSLSGPADTIEAAPVVKDVWSRSGSRYRIRAIVLLAVNVLLFAGVGGFAYWLRTGVRVAPAVEGYWDTVWQTFWSVPLAGHRDAGASLGALLLTPISVQDVPMQIPIVGLLMAALISIPILASLLYRFWSSLPFIAVVGFLAVMPWLAIALLLSCLIVSSRLFRTRFRFVSALLALLPAVVFLILAWHGTTDLVAGRIDPVDRVKFIAPWVLAIVAAAVVFAVVLAIAKLVDYRPGAITPLLAVMFGLPVALFEFHVGRDELYYRLLEARSENHFADEYAAAPLEQMVQEAWERHPPPRPSRAAIRSRVETRWLFELATEIAPNRSALARHQAELVAQCDRFLAQFPTSRYAPNALFIKARALDMRVDPGEFRRTKWIRYYDCFPSPASREPWRMLLHNRPDSVLGAAAQLRLAQLDAREGDVERAIAKLENVCTRFGQDVATDDTPESSARSLREVLARGTAEATLHIPVERVFLEARRYYDLLTANRDPLYGYDPISGTRGQTGAFPFGLLDLDPRHEQYVENLRRLKARYVNCQIQDNIDLEIAKSTDETSEKIERLQRCLEQYPNLDQVPEALFRLGVALRAADHPERSEALFARLERDYPTSIWNDQAMPYRARRTAHGGSWRSAGGAQATPGDGL
jgi:outer membrane protein assembly factor BamD (BamD/ComL family)